MFIKQDTMAAQTFHTTRLENELGLLIFFRVRPAGFDGTLGIGLNVCERVSLCVFTVASGSQMSN